MRNHEGDYVKEAVQFYDKKMEEINNLNKNRSTMSDEQMKKYSTKKKVAIFNGKYQIIKMLGDGKNSNVYLCFDRKDPNKKFALKLFRQKYLKKGHAIGQITQEANVLKN